MLAVKPSTWTTLLVDKTTYYPFGVATAKGALYTLLKNRGHGMDANDVPYDFEAMKTGKLTCYPDHPILRSAPNVVTGEETVWPIPTVLVINESFFHGRGKKYRKDDVLPSVKEVWQAARQICAFCGTHVSFKDASREHVQSRSNGGTDHSWNIALSHKSCNSAAGNIEPKLDHKGAPVKCVKIVKATHFIFPEDKMDLRSEFKTYMGIK